MVSFVFKPSRAGRKSLLWSGRYRFDDMAAPVEVPLHTADKMTALKRLSDLIVRKQRESEGLAAPAPMRAAQASSFTDLVGEYAVDLHAQGLNAQHIKDSTRRVLRIARECRWARLGEANAAAFTTWRGKVAPTLSAKYLKEYQVSLRAFFTWLIETERYDRNPFAKVKLPQTRGRETRVRRAFTLDEARRLLAVADYHRIPYLTLFYTGFRYKAAWGLRWGDYRTDAGGGGPRFVLVANRDKGRRERIVPVRPELAAELDAWRASLDSASPGERIFKGIFPRQRTDKKRPNALRLDMAKANIPITDELDRTIDYHSFRKTFATWAMSGGVPLRAAQALLGHASPEMTARAYTDETGLGLAAQVQKLEWIGGEESPPLNDTTASVSGSGELSAQIAEVLATRFFAMVDATGLEPVTPSV
jgi:integrase